MGPSDGDIGVVSEKKYWKKRNKRTDRWAGALDQALGISETRYTMPKSFNGGIPPAYSRQPSYSNQQTKRPLIKKKKHKSVILVIDTQNPNQIKVKGFKAKQKHSVKKKEKKQDMTIFGM